MKKLIGLGLIAVMLGFFIPVFAEGGYDFVRKWGSSGSGDLNFRYPTSVALDSTGNVYVCDLDNACVKKFDSDGKFIKKWGSYGSGDGQFDQLFGIAVDSSGNVYVIDSRYHLTDANIRVQKFDANGNFLKKWGSRGNGDGQFVSPKGIAVDSANNVYVVDFSLNRVQKFDSEGGFLRKWAIAGCGQYNLNSGAKDIAVDSAGNVYVLEVNNVQIEKFDSNGNFIKIIGGRGSEEGKFDLWAGNVAGGIGLDGLGNLYVADVHNERIQKFDPNGNFLTAWGSKGYSDGKFKSPFDAAIDSTGNVYVVDYQNHRIQKFRPTNSTSTTTTVPPTLPITITTSSTLTAGTVGAPYTATLQATGGASPYKWTSIDGMMEIPRFGLSLNKDSGVLSGTPIIAGTLRFTAIVTDSLFDENNPEDGHAASKEFVLTISPASFAIGPETLPQPRYGESYSATLQAIGGTPPYNWSILESYRGPGGLEVMPGIFLNPTTGTVSGKKCTSAPGKSFNFKVQVKDRNGNTAEKRYPFSAVESSIVATANTTPSGIVIMNESLSNAQASDQRYRANLQAQIEPTATTSQYSWSIVPGQGVLPPNFRLQPSSTLRSSIYRTFGPTMVGRYEFTVQIKDQRQPLNVATKRLSITVTN